MLINKPRFGFQCGINSIETYFLQIFYQNFILILQVLKVLLDNYEEEVWEIFLFESPNRNDIANELYRMDGKKSQMRSGFVEAQRRIYNNEAKKWAISLTGIAKLQLNRHENNAWRVFYTKLAGNEKQDGSSKTGRKSSELTKQDVDRRLFEVDRKSGKSVERLDYVASVRAIFELKVRIWMNTAEGQSEIASYILDWNKLKLKKTGVRNRIILKKSQIVAANEL